MSNILLAVVILFFVTFTINEGIMILQEHPIFTFGCIIIFASYAMHSNIPWISNALKVIGIIIATLIVYCIIAAVSDEKK